MSKKDRASLSAKLRVVVESIAAVRVEAQDVDSTYRSSIGRILVRLSLLIHEGAGLEESLGHDWRKWAAIQAQGFGPGGSNPSPPTVYRFRNAGAVAAVLGEAVGEASYLALAPLYRLLAAAKNEEELVKATAQVTATWAAACKSSKTGVPTEEHVRTLVEKIATKGTRGAAGKSAAQRKTAQTAKNAAVKRSRNEPTAGAKDNETTITLDAAAIEAANRVVSSFVKKAATTHSIEGSAVRAIMLGTIRLVREHGADCIAATLK